MLCAVSTVVMSPAHCYYDNTPAVATLVPLYYQKATAQIGRHAHSNPVLSSAAPPCVLFLLRKIYELIDAGPWSCCHLTRQWQRAACRTSFPNLPVDSLLAPDPFDSIQAQSLR